MPNIIRLAAIILIAALYAGCAAPRLAIEPPPGHHPQPKGQPFSHQKLDNVLARIVVPATGLVDYDLLTEQHLALLDDYLIDAAEAQPERWPASDQKAFWINVHNAAAMRNIAEHWPIEQLREISDSPLSTRFFVAARWLSIEQMQELVNSRFNDPLMVYALNWGAASAPPLAFHPYTAVGLPLQLRQQADAWIEQHGELALPIPENPDWSVNAAR